MRKLKETEDAVHQAEDANEANKLKQATINTLEGILDGINTSIYLTVPETGELLFVNKWLKAFMGRENDDLTGEYCYKVFRGFEEMCDFCPCPRLNVSPEQTVVWEECFQPYNIYVRHTHSYIDWPDGEKAHLQYGIDVTEIHDKEKAERAAHQAELARVQAEAVAKAMRESITYASKIQKNLLPHDSDMQAVFSDSSVIWKPRDIVGGDIYWMKRFDTGTVLCVADCTGHGTPGALLTMLVVSTLESIVWTGSYSDTADLMRRLDKRLAEVLHIAPDDKASDDKDKTPAGLPNITDIYDGCDLVLFYISKEGDVRFSSGRIPVFVSDGKEVRHHKGQKLSIGEGKLRNKDEVETIEIPANPDNKFYVASDGLFDQIGGESGTQFGYETFKALILEHHHERQSVITAKVREAFEQYRNNEPHRDDFELVAFKP